MVTVTLVATLPGALPSPTVASFESRHAFLDKLPMKKRSVLLTLSLLLPILAFAAERGVFGFAMEVDGEGLILNPTVRSIKTSRVTPGSPAASAGMRAGDDVVEVAGRVVAGAKGRDIQALAEKEVGQSLTLTIQHPGEKATTVAMIAAEKPRAK